MSGAAGKRGGGRGRREGEAWSRGRPYVLKAALLELLHRGVLGRLLQPLGAVGRADVQPQNLAREDLLLLHEHRAAVAAAGACARRPDPEGHRGGPGAGPGRPRAPSLAAAAAPPRLPSAGRPPLAATRAVAAPRRLAAGGALSPPRRKCVTGCVRSTPGSVVFRRPLRRRRRAGSASRDAPGACREV